MISQPSAPPAGRIPSPIRLSALGPGAVVLVLVPVLMLGSGCRSSSTPVPRQSPGPVEIQGIDVRPAVPGAVLEILADGPLQWTAMSDVDGHLILELEHSLPLASLTDLSFDEGLVEEVEVTVEPGRRPRTRLMVRTRDRVDFSSNTIGSSLQIRLLPQGGEDLGALASEPLRIDDFGQPVATEATAEKGPETATAELDASEAAGIGEPTPQERPPEAVFPAEEEVVEESLGEEKATEELRLGTPGAPEEGGGVDAPPASRLLAVRWIPEEGLELQADGSLRWQSFWLEDPPRFVIDLPGVLKGEVAPELPAGGVVAHVRTGQFSTVPEPISRVVLDLEAPARIRVESNPSGLMVRVDPEGR